MTESSTEQTGQKKGKEAQKKRKEVSKGEYLLDAGRFMLIDVVHTRSQTDSDVVIVGDGTAGELTITTSSGEQHRFRVVGTDQRTPLTRVQAVMQIE